MKKTIIKSGIVLSALMPIIVFAQQKDLAYIVQLVVKYFNVAIYLIMGLAVVMFVWNIFKYFIKGGDDIGAKKEAGQYVLWSVVGFFVILSFWGMVNILTNTFKLDSQQPSGFFGTFGGSSGGGTQTFTGGTNTNFGQGTQTVTGGTNTNRDDRGFIRKVWGIVW
jgi:hypothetical protein